jgi:hypothetical protein
LSTVHAEQPVHHFRAGLDHRPQLMPIDQLGYGRTAVTHQLRDVLYRQTSAAGVPVTVWLTGEAVWFAVPDRQPDLALPHATPVAELVETIRTGLRSGSAASAPRGVISWSRT